MVAFGLGIGYDAPVMTDGKSLAAGEDPADHPTREELVKYYLWRIRERMGHGEGQTCARCQS